MIESILKQASQIYCKYTFDNTFYRLEGHTDVAAYALDWHPSDPIVASGGRDRQILLWNVD